MTSVKADPTPADYRARIEAAAGEVEDLRDQLQDAIDRRNEGIVDAVEHHAAGTAAVAGWAGLSKPMVARILADT